MIEKAAVVGASGYVGRYVLERLGARGIGTYARRPAAGLVAFDITRDPLDILLKAAGGRLTHLILAGAAANPEECAKEPEATRALNVTGALRVMDEARDAGITPVFLSTDYVFKGDAGNYHEDDEPAPTTAYGAQKAEAERGMRQWAEPWLIARLSKVVGPETDVHSIIGQWAADIKAGKAMRVATDQVFSPAWAADIAHGLVDLCEQDRTGIWHVAGPKPVSRYDLASLLAEEVRRIAPLARIDLSACKLNDIPFRETRPLETWLNTDKLSAFLPWRFRTMQDLCAETARRHFG